MKYLSLIFPFLFFISCASESNLIKKYKESSPTPMDFPGAGAVVLLDEGRLEVDVNTFRVRYYHKKVMKFFSNETAEKYKEAIYVYNPKYFDLLKFRGFVITEDGRVLKADLKIEEERTRGNVTARKLRLIFPELRKGSIAILERESEEEMLLPKDWYFASKYPTLVSRFTLIIPEGFIYKYNSSKGVPPPIVEKLASREGYDWVSYTWEMDSLEAMGNEPYSPSIEAISPKVSFAPWSILGYDVGTSWDGVVELLRQFYTPSSIPDTIKRLAERIVEGAETSLDSIKRLFYFVQREIEYRYEPWDVGGIAPKDPLEVLRDEYGVCKDKFMLFRALSQALNFHVNPVFVRSFTLGPIDTLLPSLQFDHVMAQVVLDDKKYLVDPTLLHIPFGQIPIEIYGADALLIEDDGYSFFKIPVPTPDLNSAKIELDGYVSEEGGLEGDVRVSFSGYLGTYMRQGIGNMKEEEIKDKLNDESKAQGVPLIVEEAGVENLNEPERPLIIRAKIKLQNFASKTGGIYSFVPFLYSLYIPKFTSRKRKYPILFGKVYSIYSTITLNFEGEVEFEEDTTVFIISRWFSYSLERSKSGVNSLTFKEHFALKKHVVDAKDYTKVKEILAEINNLHETPLSIGIKRK